MKFDRIDFIVGVTAIVVICVFLLVVRVPFTEWFQGAAEKQISLIEECTMDDNAPLCARNAVKELLELMSGTELMSALSERLSAQQCHYIGHVVGQQSFIKYRSIEAAIGQCDRTCDSACVHGIIGEAFAQELGLDSVDAEADLDLKHLSPLEMQRVGKRLCDSPESCHGVGHALFQIYAEFTPALEVCRLVATEATKYYCYQGIFMEYADVLYARNMRPVAGVEYPTRKNVTKLCDLPTFEERRSCFRYFPRMAVSTFEDKDLPSAEVRARLGRICRAYERDEDRIACLVGIGVYSSYTLVTDVTRAVKACADFSSLQDQAACNFGQISVATQDRDEQVIAYCAALSNARLQESCYQGVFFFLNRLGTPRDESRALCGEDTLCVAAAAKYQTDPWEAITSDFAP